MAARADFTLRITAHNYNNSDHRLSDGSCCDCCDCDCIFATCPCENRFTFCLLPSNAAMDNDSSNCELNPNTTPGRYATGEIASDDFQFTNLESADFPNVENGIMTFHGTGPWPVSAVCRNG